MTFSPADAQALIDISATLNTGYAYDFIDYSDPVSVGILGWSGTSFITLCTMLASADPTDWASIPTTLTTDLATQPSQDFWAARWLTPDEGEPLRTVLAANPAVQNSMASWTVTNMWEPALAAIGLSSSLQPDTSMFYILMWEQDIPSAQAVVRDCGLIAPLLTMEQTALNNPTLNTLTDRYAQGYDLIVAGDPGGSTTTPQTPSAPPTFGDPGEGSDAPATSATASPPSAAINQLTPPVSGVVSAWGNFLLIPTSSGSTVTAQYVGSNIFLPPSAPAATGVGGSPDTGTDANPAPPTPPSASTAAKAAALIAFAQAAIGRFKYSQGPGRLNPTVSGYTDCSGFVRWVYNSVLGIIIGNATKDQYLNGTRVLAANAPMTTNLLAPADLIYYKWNNMTGVVNHVEMYIGGTTTIGHGGPGVGPQLHPLLTWNASHLERYYVQRWV